MFSFNEFYSYVPQPDPVVDDLQIVHLYYHSKMPVREIRTKTGRSIGEIYRLIKQYGEPNRRRNHRQNVISLHDSGLNPKHVADLTGYSTRHVRNIIKKHYEQR